MNTKTNEIREQTNTKLQELVRINVDSANGFDKAAELIKEPRLESVFRDLSRERRGFANDLKRFVDVGDNGHDLDEGTLKAKVHRWWIDIRAKAMQNDAHNLLAEAERGEDSIRKTYEEILPEIAGSPINDVLLKQYEQIKRGHDRIRRMRDGKHLHDGKQ